MTYHDTGVNSGNITPTVISDDVKISDNVQDREALITKLKSITPKNSLEHKLLSNPDYLNHLTDKQINLILMEQKRMNLNRVKKITKTKEEGLRQYRLHNKKDNLGFRKRTDRRLLPEWHVLRKKPYIPVPIKNSLDWHYKIPSNHNTIFAFNKIKNLLHLLFIRNTRVYVIRMDLFTDYTEAKDLEKVNGMFNRLFVERLYKDELFLSYCCSRENSEEGIHLHCYFFFKDMDFTTAYRRIWKLGEKWKEVGGKRWYSRNLAEDKLPHWELNSIIGRVDYSDFFRIEKLLHCMKYLIKDLSNRDWLDESESNGPNKLFTCTSIVKDLDVIKQYEDGVSNNKIVRNGYYLSYQWLYRIGLNYNDTVFKDTIDRRFYKNRLAEPISRYLEKQKVDIHDYKRLAY